MARKTTPMTMQSGYADKRAPSTEAPRNKQEAQRQIDKLISQNKRTLEKLAKL